MLMLSDNAVQVYAEAYLPRQDGQEQDALSLLRLLLTHRLLAPDQFFLYRDTAGETRIVGDPLFVVRVDCETISSICIETNQVCQKVPGSDPFKQVEELLWTAPITSWTAYGYITFDLMRHSLGYGKEKAVTSPLLYMFIPKLEIRLSRQGTYLRCVSEQVIETITTLWENGMSQGYLEPAQPAPIPITTHDRSSYEQGVEALIAAILQDASNDGPLQKAILSRRFEVQGPMDLLATYALAQRDPAARSFCFQLGEDAACGASPEILLQTNTFGLIQTRPLAGTRWRGQTQEEDARLRTQLCASRKQQIEHLISVLAVQGELETICQPDTIFIQHMAHVQQYRTVQHLASQICGQLAVGKTSWDALRAVFPGVTVSGADKAAAIAWIDRLEQTARGLYAGAIGWISHDGSADLAIAIRTIFQRGSETFMQAGAGIVLDSDPADEYEETWHKMRTMWPYFVPAQNS